MIITRLEEFTKRGRQKSEKDTDNPISDKACYRIYLDYEYAFPLMGSDLKKYSLKQDSELSENLYNKLLDEAVYPRAQHKALNLLKLSDRSEAELIRKLSEQGFPEYIINRALTFVSDYGYLNDERYATNYINIRKESKSRMFLKSELEEKGINKMIIDKLLLSEYEEPAEDPEIIAINKAIQKKVRLSEPLNYEEKQKLIAYLYRKGFPLDKIRQALNKQ